MRVLLIYLEPLKNEPLGLMYIGTVLKNEGHHIKIIGTEEQRLLKRSRREISNYKPDVIGISITTPLANKAYKINHFIKDRFPKIITIAGGPHPTILASDVLINGRFDICVIGEGENTAVDLLKTIASKYPLEAVRGIAFLRNGKPMFTEEREYIYDLDRLPFVDRELMPKKVIYGRAGYPLTNPSIFLITARGCPFQCSFCQPTVDKIFGRKARKRSPENVISEILELKRKYDTNGFWINDDTFLLDNAWVNRFCELILKERLDITWYVNGRLNNVNRDVVMNIRNAGCVGLVLTPETGSQRIRNSILNKNVSDDQVLNAYKICHEIGIPVQANIMLASPTETTDDLKLSIELIKKIQPHFMNFSYTTALPGTYLNEEYDNEINVSRYYQAYENYDVGVFKKLKNDIPDYKLRAAWKLFYKRYSKNSFPNRARHFFKYPYFRQILYKRWKSLIFSRHSNIKHFIFDILAIVIGSIEYFRNKNVYDAATSETNFI